MSSISEASQHSLREVSHVNGTCLFFLVVRPMLKAFLLQRKLGGKQKANEDITADVRSSTNPCVSVGGKLAKTFEQQNNFVRCTTHSGSLNATFILSFFVPATFHFPAKLNAKH
jgi:hypothetical protein